MNDFYVYEHWRPDTNQCFYVGKGRGNRSHRFKNRNKYWQCVVGKLRRNDAEVEVRLVFVGLTNEEAATKEVERIAYWRSLGVVLTNATDGGDGSKGYKHTKEARVKISMLLRGNKRAKGNKNGLGYKHSEEVRAMMSEALKGNKYGVGNKSNLGRSLPDETKIKIAKANVGKCVLESTRFKLSAASKGRAPFNKGKPTSPEVRAKISKSLKKYFADVS